MKVENEFYELNRSLPNHYCCFNLQQLLNINSIIIKESNLNLFGRNREENKLTKFYGCTLRQKKQKLLKIQNNLISKG